MRLFISALMVLLASVASAADLTGQDVQLWIKTMPALEDWLDKQEEKMPEADLAEGDTDINAIFQRGIQDLKNAGIYDDFNKEVKAAGFRNVEHWADVSQHISLAFIALEMADSKEVSASQLEAQLKEIRGSSLPAEQKQMLEQMLNASLSMMKAVDKVSAADKAAVLPYREQLAKQFDDSGEE